MKILSHDINMSSKHVQYKSVVESKLSFGSMIPTGSQESKEPQELQEIQRPHAFRRNAPINESIEAIIQRLIGMLSSRRQTEIPEQKENAIGYLRTSFHKKIKETECLDFSTKGLIKTDKGELDFKVNFSMSRSFVVENNIDIYTAFDPLVINLDGEIPQLSDDAFSFDLDNDGESDQISKLKGNSGFLAYDKDDDGVINQGTELFGTLTGNGFDELRGYDLDENGWIDENDSIFNKLQVWFKNEDTKEKELVGLGEAGVGAIFLESTQSEFTFKTQTNKVLGEMKSGGIFLNENGTVGHVAQIDFSSQKREEPLAELLRA